MSQPSVRTKLFVTSSISPLASRASVASRSALGVVPSMCFGANAGPHEFVAQVNAVRNVDSKGDGLSPLTKFVPMGDDIANKLRPVHSLGELAFDVIAKLNLDAFQIGIDWRIDPRLDQIALLDQFRDLRTLDDGVENSTEAAAVTTTRSRRRSKQDRIGIGFDY
jgi:hypothetical protein